MSLIPDTLTIFITTKIPSYIDFIYNSKNTLPDTNTSVLMNPLILLKSEITNPNILFDKTLFEIQLREDRLTKIPTLIQATKDNFISKNIKTILTILFAKGKVIYLGDYPFTIHNMTWNGSWSIQHKFSTSLTNIKDYLLANEKQSVLDNNLLNSLPLEVRTNNDKDYFLQYLTNLYLIKGSIAEPITNKELFVNDNDFGINNILKSIKLDKLPNNLQFIINNYRSNYLIYISGIYYNLTTDPLILILFYTDKTYNDSSENYINIPKYIHQNVYLEELFNIFKEKRILLNTTNYNFWNIWKNLSYQQKTIEDLYKQLSKMFAKTPTLNYSNVETIMNNIEISQKEFFKLFVIYFQSFLNTLHAQKSYYKSTLLFLEELNNVYSGNILNVQLNIENEHLIIQRDIKIFQCIVDKFENPYTSPMTSTSAKNIITYYKEVYDKYIKIIFNLMKLKSYIFFNKIKEDKELIDFYIFQNYKLNLLILSNYEYLKTYINDCLQDYKDLLINHNSSSFVPRPLTTTAKGLALPPPKPPKIDVHKLKKDLDDLDKENKDLKLKIAEAEKLKIKLAKLEADKKKLKAEKKKLEAAGGVKDDRIRALELEIADKDRRIADLDGEVIRLRASQRILTERVRAQRAEIVGLGLLIDNIHDINQRLVNEVADLTRQVTEKERQRTAILDFLRRVQADNALLRQQLADATEENRRLEQENADTRRQNRALTEEIARKVDELRHIREMYQALSARVDGMLRVKDDEIAGLRAEITGLNDRIRRIEDENRRRVADLNDQIGELGRQLAAAQAAQRDLQAENARFQADNAQLQADKTALEAANATLQAEKDRYQNLSIRLFSDLEESGNRIRQLQADKAALEAENTRLREDNEILTADRDAQLAENARLRRENEAQIAELQKQIEATQKQLADTEEELKKQGGKVIAQQIQLDQITRQLTISNAAFRARTTENNRLKDEIAALKVQQAQQEELQAKQQAEIESSKKLIDELLKQQAEKEASLITPEELEDKLKELKEKHDGLLGEIQHSNRQLQVTENDLLRAYRVIDGNKVMLKLKTDKLAASESLLAEEKDKTKGLEAGIGTLQQEIQEKDLHIKDQEEEITRLRDNSERQQARLDEIERNKAIQTERLKGIAERLRGVSSKLGDGLSGGNPNPLFKKMAALDLSRISQLGSTIITGIKDSVKKFIDKSIVDNYLTSLQGNITLYTKLAPTSYDDFMKKIDSLKKKSKALIPQDDQEYYQFITNSILTYSIIVLIVYIIQIILFQYLNYNSSCLNYFIIQKEYSTFNYLYTMLYHKKLKGDNTFSIPFSIQTYNFDNDIDQLQSINISYFEEIIYCNSLICEYSIDYNQVNSQVNKLFSNITPELNENMLIVFCNISSSSVLNINDGLLNYDFRNKINDISFNFLRLDEYTETLQIQQYLLDIVDSGVYLKFLPKEEYISVNNWWLNKIDITELSKKFDIPTYKDNLSQIIKYYEFSFKNEYDKLENYPYLLLNYSFICSEIKILGDFRYIEMLGNDYLRTKLFHFCKSHIILEELEEFNFNDINGYITTIISKDVNFTKKIHTINNLYNTLFPNYFDVNELFFTQLYNLVTITTDASSYESIVNELYNLYYKMEDLEKLENKLNTIYLRITKNISNSNHYKRLFKKMSELNIYCSDNLLEYTLIILIYLLKKWEEAMPAKKVLKLKNTNVLFDPIDYFFYQNLIDHDRYYYIIQKSSNNYEIGDELFHKSSKKIYIILNKFTFTSETKFQIINADYVNNSNLSIFNNKVEIISLDLTKYILRKTTPLKMINTYYNQDISKKITFIYENNTNFYLLNNLCLYSNNTDLENTDLNTQFDMLKLDNYMIYFLFYKLVLFNNINCIQYKTCIKNYCLVGLSNISLRNYESDFLKNNSYFKYIKTYYQNILYFYIINYYTQQNEKIDILELNLLIIYKIFKLQKITIFEKEKPKIEAKLKDKLRRYLSKMIAMRGGVGDSIVKTGSTPTINITTPITKDSKEDKDKISKVELLEKSPFSYFIHIELDLYPGKLSEEEAEKEQTSLLKGIASSCKITQKNIEKNIADIRNIPYKQSSYTPKELLTMDPSFPINKFIPNYIEPLDKKEQKKKEEEKKKEEKERKREERRKRKEAEKKKKEEDEKKKQEEEEEEEEKRKKKKKGGNIDQIANPYPSFLNEYLKG
jgi:chromosome segregation ATPase